MLQIRHTDDFPSTGTRLVHINEATELSNTYLSETQSGFMAEEGTREGI